MSRPTPSQSRFDAVIAGVQKHGVTDAVRVLEPLVEGETQPALQGEMARLLGFYWLRQRQFGPALRYCEIAAQRLPHNPDAAFNLPYVLCQLGRLDEAISAAQAARLRVGDSVNLLALLSNMLAVSGRGAEARAVGSHTLVAKDALTAGVAGHDPRGVPLPTFDGKQPARHIIAFSLFGADPKYVQSAIANAEAARYVYPGWCCRFYLDASVPAPAVARLQALGAQVVMAPADKPAVPWGTLWRFLVADDAGVDRYLVRDADSVVNVREAVAVNEWLASDRHFHVMRDHFDHSDLVLAGLWGGVRGALPPLADLATRHLARAGSVQNRTADQEFLRDVLWPTIRRSLLTHDSQFDFGEHRDFAPHTALPKGQHVGGDARQLLAPRPADAGAATG